MVDVIQENIAREATELAARSGKSVEPQEIIDAREAARPKKAAELADAGARLRETPEWKEAHEAGLAEIEQEKVDRPDLHVPRDENGNIKAAPVAPPVVYVQPAPDAK